MTKISQIFQELFSLSVVEALVACRIVTLNCFSYQKVRRSVVHLRLETAIVLEDCSFIAGKWTAISALDYGMPVTLIGESVFARCLSSLKVGR
jgi:6-phosphogluconate dehydrogenase